MCGPSSQEQALQSSSSNFANTLQSNYSTLMGNQQNLMDQINRTLSPITAAGPSQNGFSGAESATLQTQAINNAGAANTAAQQAARTYGAGQGGGGTSGVTSGITKQIQSAIGSQQAGNLATNENNINLANEQQGNANYWKAQGAEASLLGQYGSATGNASSGAIGENSDAFKQANQITAENNAEGEDIAGFATALAGSAGGIAKAFKS